MITLLKEKLGFGPAAEETTFHVGQHASLKSLFKNVPREGFFYIKHAEIEQGNDSGLQELYVFQDGAVVLAREQDPHGLECNKISDLIKNPPLSKADSKPSYAPTDRLVYKDNDDVFELLMTEEVESRVIYEIRGNMKGDTDLEDLMTKADRCIERTKKMSGITTTRPQGFLNRLVHYGCVKVTELISPQP